MSLGRLKALLGHTEDVGNYFKKGYLEGYSDGYKDCYGEEPSEEHMQELKESIAFDPSPASS